MPSTREREPPANASANSSNRFSWSFYLKRDKDRRSGGAGRALRENEFFTGYKSVENAEAFGMKHNGKNRAGRVG